MLIVYTVLDGHTVLDGRTVPTAVPAVPPHRQLFDAMSNEAAMHTVCQCTITVRDVHHSARECRAAMHDACQCAIHVRDGRYLSREWRAGEGCLGSAYMVVAAQVCKKEF